MSHLLQHNLLSCHQFSFGPQSSTQEAVLTATVMTGTITLIPTYLHVACVLSATFFDTVKFNYRIGVTGPLHKWFSDYLSDCQQRVVLDGHQLSTVSVVSEVPQGSILGPLLFSISMDQLTHATLSVEQLSHYPLC